MDDILYGIFVLIILIWYWYIFDLHNILTEMLTKSDFAKENRLHNKTLKRLKLFLLLYGLVMTWKVNNSNGFLDFALD